MMNKKELRLKIEELNKVYEDVKDSINIERANGSLSELCSLRDEFDETFDMFFDDEDLRKKYNDYYFEDESILFEKSNDELLQELDQEDLEKYIKFYEDYIENLTDELDDLYGLECDF